MIKKFNISALLVLLALCAPNTAISQNWYDGLSDEQIYHFAAARIGGANVYANLCDDLELNEQEIDALKSDVKMQVAEYSDGMIDDLIPVYRQEVVLSDLSEMSNQEACDLVVSNVESSIGDNVALNLLKITHSSNPTPITEQSWVYQIPAGQIYEIVANAFGIASAYAYYCSELDFIDPLELAIFFEEVRKYGGRGFNNEFGQLLNFYAEETAFFLSARDESACETGFQWLTQKSQKSGIPVLLVRNGG